MATEIPIIRSLDEFRALVEALYQKIENARERRRLEYIALGRTVPDRISFEDLDLSRYLPEMLSIQKTLQWRGHNPHLGALSSKARLVAVAGICELVKNEYMGRFWETYQKLIGWGPDSTVYDWLWEKGFREEGIELIRNSAGSRQFVQSLILESGIPKRRIGDIIEFFVIYYRYLRHNQNIEDLITRLSEGSLILPALSTAERARLADICNNAADYSRAFALVVQKLNVVFDFIEKSGEIISKNIRDYTELIYEKTGIHPLEILRDPEQLERLYNRLLGFVTPVRLRRILATISPGTTVRLPSGKTISAGKYRFLQYGEHLIGSSSFICVPSAALSPEKLASLPYNQLLELEGGLLLKSQQKLKVTIGGFERFDVVHWLFTRSMTSSRSEGAVFYSEIPPAAELIIRDETGRLIAERPPQTGFSSSLSLGYFGNHEQHRHGLKIDVHRFRLYYPSLADQKLLFVTENPEDKPLMFSVDGNGSVCLEQRYIRIRSPRSGQVIVKALHFDSRQEVVVRGKSLKSSLQLDKAMLFAPIQQWQISPVKKGRSNGFGYKNLVLFLAGDLPSDSVQLVNLKITGQCSCGEYKAFSLEWVEKGRSCSIEISLEGSGWFWRFDQYSDYTLDITKVAESHYKGIILGAKEGKQAEDFALWLSPVPVPEIRASLLWSIGVNDGMPELTRFESGPAGQLSTGGIKFDSAHFRELLKPTIESFLSGILRVEISLVASGHTLASDRIWLFPDLEVETKELIREGWPVEAVVSCGSKCLSVALTDQNGNKEASLDLRRDSGHWQLFPREYSSEIFIEEAGIRWKISLTPKIAGAKLGLHSGKTETLRNMFKRELGDYDLLMIAGTEETPSVSVNGRTKQTVRETNQKVSLLHLGSLEDITRPKNQVNIRTRLHEWSFEIFHKLTVDHVKIHEFVMAETIIGEIAFLGPMNSGVAFVAYEGNDGREERGRAELVSTMEDSLEKRSFTINLKDPPVRGSGYIVKLFLLADIRNRQSIQEYGQSWRVSQQPATEPVDFESIIAAAKSEMEHGRYFQARNLLYAIEPLTPEAEKTRVREMVTRIEFVLCRKRIESIIRQARRVLKKEYSLEEFKE
jgi:hypothetical protein